MVKNMPNFSICKRLLLVFSGLLVLSLPQVFAQTSKQSAEIVPTEDEVYHFLHQLRVSGLVPSYQHETRPTDRGTILTLLESLQTERQKLSTTQWQWLQYFHKTFAEKPEDRQTVLEKGTGNHADRTYFRIPLAQDTEKYFYYNQTDDWRFVAELQGKAQFRVAQDKPNTYRGLGVQPYVTLRGDYRGKLGFYSSTFDGWQLSSAPNRKALAYDPELRNLFYISYYMTHGLNPEGSFDRTSASLRWRKEAFMAEIANERLNLGATFSDPIILSSESDYYPFARVGLATSKVRYQFIHARISQPSVWEQDPQNPSFGLLRAPQRYLGVHRVEISPRPSYRIAFSEMVVYANRSLELGYLNPLFPFKTSEHAQWDQDNALFAIETTIRLKPKWEGHLVFLADDLSFALIGKQSYHVKWALQTGVGYALDFGLLSLEYTRVEPFTYTHRFSQNGYYFNAYEHNGFALGHPIGPNADQWLMTFKGWFPKRIRGEVRLGYNRQGENYTDAQGALVNVGGDLLNGGLSDVALATYRKIFLSGNVRKGPTAAFLLTYEPLRGLKLRATGWLERWDKTPTQGFAKAEFVVDF